MRAVGSPQRGQWPLVELPPEKLHGHPAEREQPVREPGALHRHQGLSLECRGDGRPLGKPHDPAGRLPEGPEPDRVAGRAVQAGRPTTLGQLESIPIGHYQEALILDE